MSDRLPWFRCFPSALLGALSGMEPEEGFVYVTLLLRIYETGHAVAETAKTISRRTGLSERKVSAGLASLIASGKVTKVDGGALDCPSTHAELEWQRDRHRGQSQAGKASAAKRAEQPSAEKNDASRKKFTAVEGEKTKQNQQIEATDVELPFNHLEEEEEVVQEEATPLPEPREAGGFPPNAFETFWARYPHKVGKDAAKNSFDRVRKSGRVKFADLLAALDRYIANKPVDRSWCNGSTWLNQGRWQDEYPSGPPPSGAARPPASGAPPSRHGALNLLQKLREQKREQAQRDWLESDFRPVSDDERDGGSDGALHERAGRYPERLPAEGYPRLAYAGRR